MVTDLLLGSFGLFYGGEAVEGDGDIAIQWHGDRDFRQFLVEGLPEVAALLFCGKGGEYRLVIAGDLSVRDRFRQRLVDIRIGGEQGGGE